MSIDKPWLRTYFAKGKFDSNQCPRSLGGHLRQIWRLAEKQLQ